MSSKLRPIKWATALVLIAAVGIAVWAAVAQELAVRQVPYSGYDETTPWFDGKSHPWFLDMFNQQSIKPQEEGSFQEFPEHSVPRQGVEPVIGATEMVGNQLRRDVEPENPVPGSAASVARGRVVYDTYCTVCHGADGMGNMPILQRGMPAPPIRPMLPALTEAHLYNKARYGGPIMPAYGFQTTREERWDLVNYMKSPQFGREATQE